MVGAIDLDVNSKINLLSNLSFDHPLTDAEFYDLGQLLSSSVLLSQVYFKDNIDIESIEKIKSLLELLPNIDDAKVEKFIMKKLSNDEKVWLTNTNFANIDTWNVAYLIEGNKYEITSLTKYRILNEWFNQIIEELGSLENVSILDKVCYLYDRIKLFNYDSSSKYNRLPEIISNRKASSCGYNLVFKEVLSRLNIPSFVCKTSMNDENFVSLISINDDVYKVNGIYLFDPSSDTIFKDQYRNNLARQMNYNFFAITLDKYNNSFYNGNAIGLLKPLSARNMDEYNYYLNSYIRHFGKSEIERIEQEFNMPFSTFYDRVRDSNDISKDTILKVISKRLDKYPDVFVSKDFLIKTVTENYNMRNTELFSNNYVKRKKMDS